MINQQSGFIALISAIIISVLLLTLTVTVGMTGFFGRLNIFDAESKERSSELAESCADIAILDLIQSITIPSSVSVGSDECLIKNIIHNAPSSSKTTIKTQAAVNNAYTNFYIIVDDDFGIISWEECSNLSSSTTSC